MTWNWELPDWPKFKYDRDSLSQRETQFLLKAGSSSAFLKNIDKQDYSEFVVEILSLEGAESSKIEGEFLDRESLQSSIKKHFGLSSIKREDDKESRMAKLLWDVYESFAKPLTSDMLFKWHSKLFSGMSDIVDCGKYRTHIEPMQVVSNKYGSLRVFFEAPPSRMVSAEMVAFIKWFNSATSEPILGKAAIAHVYFESIHPFEDGNGRIGRLLVEKILSQGIGRPLLIAISKVLEKRKKEYYAAIEQCNRTLDVQHFVDFFAQAILQAQEESLNLVYFLVAKAKIFTKFSGLLNSRQEKVLIKMFAEGPSGFKDGLSADKYNSITKASRATVTRDLADLVQKEILTKTGELRHTRYWLNIEDNPL